MLIKRSRNMYVGNCSTLWLETRNPPAMSGGAKTVRRIGAAMLMLQSTKDRDTPEEQAAMFVELIEASANSPSYLT